MDRPGPGCQLGGGGQCSGADARRRLVSDQCSGEAGTLRCWSVPRFCGGLLGRVAGSISSQRLPVADFIKVWSYFTTGVNYTLKFYTHAAAVIS